MTGDLAAKSPAPVVAAPVVAKPGPTGATERVKMTPLRRTIARRLVEAQQTAATYGVTSIPTVILFKGGEVAGILQGAVPKAKFTELIDSNA